MTAHETATVLRHGFQDRDGHPTLTLDPAFQGLPAMAHGGSVLGAFDLLAGLGGPRTLSGLYRRRVPLGVPLALDVARAPAEVRYQLAHDGELLVEGSVREGGVEPPASGTCPRDLGGHTLPVSRTCFACGTDNPLGLRLALHVDDGAVHGRWQPSERFLKDS